MFYLYQSQKITNHLTFSIVPVQVPTVVVAGGIAFSLVHSKSDRERKRGGKTTMYAFRRSHMAINTFFICIGTHNVLSARWIESYRYIYGIQTTWTTTIKRSDLLFCWYTTDWCTSYTVHALKRTLSRSNLLHHSATLSRKPSQFVDTKMACWSNTFCSD